MSDLSQPAAAALAFEDGDAVVWPSADPVGPVGGHPVAQPACRIEGLNGHMLDGELTSFQPQQGFVHLRLRSQRRSQVLRLAQFRRLQLTEPLRAQSAPADASDLESVRPGMPFRVSLKDAPAWTGHTIGHREEAHGLFLFEPIDGAGSMRRWYVPRTAYSDAEIGLRIGDALVEMQSVTPDQITQALSEQHALRDRKLGDMLVVRQIITAEELAEAVEQQSKMPMVRIGEALTALGFITEVQLEEALLQQRSDRSVPLGELMVRNGLVSRADLQTALARKMGYPLVDVLKFAADAEAVGKLPYSVASRVPALPLMLRAGRLVVAVEDPSNRSKIEELEFAAQCKIVPVLARTGLLSAAIDRAYEKVGAMSFMGRISSDPGAGIEFEPGDASKLLASMEMGESLADSGDDTNPIEQSDNSLVRLINSMILEAHTQGVSDIHIECAPGREKVRIRFRRDGHLRPYLELPPSYRNALIARLKIMCDLDISEKRKPQDGKIAFHKFVQGVKLELRVATIPTHSNLEDAVLRLLQSSKPIPIESLGLSPANLKALQDAASRPYGMLLCVGPTGSGKTTTLHSVLGSINKPERKIWTAEDPIEITQPGLRQVQVNPRIDWTFAKALRAFLRADPDVIMVGEIRDEETAKVAIEASLTGHLVMSTLHTNSAPETVTRLLDMGMDPFNFADALLGVLAQRLVRRLCTQCRTSRDATAEEQEELLRDWLHVMGSGDSQVEAAPQPEDVLAGWRARFGVGGRLQSWHSAGCAACGNDGFKGRAGIHELMWVSRGLRHLIQTGSRVDDLQRHALGDGMRTLRQDGIEKVLAGVTTIEEVRSNS